MVQSDNLFHYFTYSSDLDTNTENEQDLYKKLAAGSGSLPESKVYKYKLSKIIQKRRTSPKVRNHKHFYSLITDSYLNY